MNLILFTSEEIARPLPLADPRARHLLDILRRDVGGTFDAGLINGPLGKGTVEAIGPAGITLSYAWDDPPPALPPLHLLVGLPRPQTARDILRDATALGVAAIHFVGTERSEPGYARSTLWTSDEWMRKLREGAAQAFDTHLPIVEHHASLASGLEKFSSASWRLALDNYEATAALADVPESGQRPVVLALGAERGWSIGERATLRAAGFALVHLGRRVLRTETACVAAVTLLKARLGWL